jgi:hypothetical protein
MHVDFDLSIQAADPLKDNVPEIEVALRNAALAVYSQRYA